jgi:hypothetical protein
MDSHLRLVTEILDTNIIEFGNSLLESDQHYLPTSFPISNFYTEVVTRWCCEDIRLEEVYREWFRRLLAEAKNLKEITVGRVVGVTAPSDAGTNN